MYIRKILLISAIRFIFVKIIDMCKLNYCIYVYLLMENNIKKEFFRNVSKPSKLIKLLHVNGDIQKIYLVQHKEILHIIFHFRCEFNSI